ncbi:hypothetical protein M426DRAFT_24561 [Hypoxylon sp. CI-4A]|nr:hypothetical protein M426DRAFT_24561 [Hypoxylon sp. CI-4A]
MSLFGKNPNPSAENVSTDSTPYSRCNLSPMLNTPLPRTPEIQKQPIPEDNPPTKPSKTPSEPAPLPPSPTGLLGSAGLSRTTAHGLTGPGIGWENYETTRSYTPPKYSMLGNEPLVPPHQGDKRPGVPGIGPVYSIAENDNYASRMAHLLPPSPKTVYQLSNKELTEKVNYLFAQLGGHQSLRMQLESRGRQLSMLEAKVDQLEIRVNGMQKTQAELQSHVNACCPELRRADKRLEEHGIRLDEVDMRITGVREEAQDQILETKKTVEELREDTDNINNHITFLSRQVQDGFVLTN